MCLGTFIVMCPVNLLFLKVILTVEILNSWVYGLPREKNFILFLVGSTLIFEPSILEKGTTKKPMSLDQQVRMSGVQLSVLLKKNSQILSEILHEARESQGSKTDRVILFLFFERKILVLKKMPKISPKTGFFDFCQKINPFMFPFLPKNGS